MLTSYILNQLMYACVKVEQNRLFNLLSGAENVRKIWFARGHHEIQHTERKMHKYTYNYIYNFTYVFLFTSSVGIATD